MYLLGAKRLNKVTVIDVNTEIKKAISSKEMMRNFSSSIRESLSLKYKLVRNGTDGQEIILP
jgi:hypothetical protein